MKGFYVCHRIATGATEDEEFFAKEELLLFLFLFLDCANSTSTPLVWSLATGRAFSMGVCNAPPTKNAGATSRPWKVAATSMRELAGQSLEVAAVRCLGAA